MKPSNVKLPSNKKFGFFFTFVFAVASAYLFSSSNMKSAYSLAILSLTFLVISIFKTEVLLPLNRLWLRFGIFLGMIISPIVLGVIFFGFFTPIAFLMRLSGRDELRLKFSNKPSYWISRNEPVKTESFKQQF